MSICVLCVPFLSHTELTELTEIIVDATLFLCFPWFLCALLLYGLLRLTRLSAAVGLASPEGAKDYRRGYHPRVSDAQYTEDPERAKDLLCLQHSFYWLQYKRGLSSPPVFSPAFQASARSIRIFHLLLIILKIANS